MSTPLNPCTVSLILAYICPPSQLALSPLSPHLISKPLLQRHHFLDINPEMDIKNYLMWPSDGDQAFTKLEGLDPPTSSDEQSIMGIKYTADKESVFAHAELRSLSSQSSAEIRLVFMWDPIDSAWKYHNLASMPFPAHAAFTVADAHEEIWNDEDFADDDDDYWNSYGRHDEKEHFHRDKSKDGDLSEDAYWAQYASIQGSADSTIPTPKREIHDEETYDDALARARSLHSDINPNIIDISYSSLNIFPPPHNPATDPRDASSPTELSERLSALYPRSPHSSNTGYSSDSDDLDGAVKLDGYSNGKVNGIYVEGDSSPSQQTASNDMDEAIKTTIRGLYNMWSLSTSEQSGSEDEFLRLVKEAIIG